MKNKNSKIPYNCLEAGKMYDTFELRAGPKPLYGAPFDDYCGWLNQNDTFVVLELKVKGPFHWTKILTSSGVVGWIPWDYSKTFKKIA